MKKLFQEPVLEVEKYVVDDVITTSCGGYTCENDLPGI